MIVFLFCSSPHLFGHCEGCVLLSITWTTFLNCPVSLLSDCFSRDARPHTTMQVNDGEQNEFLELPTRTFLVPPEISTLGWIYEGGLQMRKTKGEVGKNKRNPFIINWIDWQWQHNHDTNYRLLDEETTSGWSAFHQRNGKDCFELLTVPPPIRSWW